MRRWAFWCKVRRNLTTILTYDRISVPLVYTKVGIQVYAQVAF